MNLQEYEVAEYLDLPVPKGHDWPVMGECTKCGNTVLESLTVIGINDDLNEKYKYDMIKCYKCDTRWFW
jgi:hypothetical protein